MKTEIISEMGIRYIKVAMDDKEDMCQNVLSDYDYNMIHYAEIPGLIRLTKRTIDEETYYTAPVYTYITMVEKLDNAILDKEEVRCFFRQLLNLYVSMQECLLSSDMLCLEPENIFYDTENQRYLFLPLVTEKKDICQGLENMLTFFIEKCDLNAQDLLEMLFQVFGYLNDEKWDVIAIMNYVIQYKYEERLVSTDNVLGEEVLEADTFEKEEEEMEKSKMKYGIGISMILLMLAFVLSYLISYQFRYSVISIVLVLAAVVLMGIYTFKITKNRKMRIS